MIPIYDIVAKTKPWRAGKRSEVSRTCERGGMNRQSTEAIQGRDNTLYDTLMMNACHCTFVQTHRCTTSRVNPKVNYGFLVIITCHCRFISCNKSATLVNDVGSGGGYACLEQRVYGKSLYLPLNFGAKLKFLKK